MSAFEIYPNHLTIDLAKLILADDLIYRETKGSMSSANNQHQGVLV